MKLTPGKLTGLKAVSTPHGIIAAAAMDQRGSLQKSIAKARGGDVTDKDMEEFKIHVTEILTRHASAILLDPEWGLPASKRRSNNAGLLLAYEKTGYDKQTPGRLPDLLDLWSVQRLKAAGADCIKILLYYTPTDPKNVNDTSTHGLSASETSAVPTTFRTSWSASATKKVSTKRVRSSPRRSRSIVIDYMREFSKDKYGVDVLKVEVPINMKYVEGSGVYGGTTAYTKKEAANYFQEAAQATTKPFIYLSAGVSNAEFTETLRLRWRNRREVQWRALRTRHLGRRSSHLC